MRSFPRVLFWAKTEMWNGLPSADVESPDLKKFKSEKNSCLLSDVVS